MSTFPTRFLDRVRRIEKDEKPKPSKKAKGSAYARLDELEAEANAGASDEFLARTAAVTLETVRAWRSARKIKKSRKRQETPDEIQALDLDGLSYNAELHITQSSIAGGHWEPPQYVLRDPLSYTDTCRLIHVLMRAGEPVEAISAGIGIRTKDVEYAAEVWDRHLLRVGRKCASCSSIYDPAFGERDLCRRCAMTGSGG